MTEPFTFTLTPAVDSVLTLTPALDAVFTLQPAASHRTLAEWIAAQAVLYFDANYPNGGLT